MIEEVLCPFMNEDPGSVESQEQTMVQLANGKCEIVPFGGARFKLEVQEPLLRIGLCQGSIRVLLEAIVDFFEGLLFLDEKLFDYFKVAAEPIIKMNFDGPVSVKLIVVPLEFEQSHALLKLIYKQIYCLRFLKCFF